MRLVILSLAIVVLFFSPAAAVMVNLNDSHMDLSAPSLRESQAGNLINNNFDQYSQYCDSIGQEMNPYEAFLNLKEIPLTFFLLGLKEQVVMLDCAGNY